MGLPSPYICPECKTAYNDPEMVAKVVEDERPWYGRLIKSWANVPEYGGATRGYRWYCGCDAICFCAWGNEFVRYGIPGQPEPIIIGRLNRPVPSVEVQCTG